MRRIYYEEDREKNVFGIKKKIFVPSTKISLAETIIDFVFTLEDTS